MHQIQGLLDLGVIKHSTYMASPLVCVLKGPCGKYGVRLARFSIFESIHSF